MTICLSHISALQALREARSKGCRPKEAGKRIPKSTSIREVEAFVAKTGFLRPLPPEEKVSILVSSQSSRSKSTKTITHVCANSAVAAIALAKPRGVFIPNLGFLFVQLAQCAPFLTLIEIGYELCGSYTILPDESTFVQCEPATNHNHLAKEIRAFRGMRGREIATRALQFVADNSASPMETKLTMFLCLKRTMGGYGLPFPKLNFPIEPTSAARKAAHKQRYVLDLYWPKRKIDVEYDSDSYHASSEGIASDAQRRNALQLMGVTVITVTRGQLYNAASFDRTARIIAASIGVRLPKTSQHWISQKQTLRYVLLKNETKPSEKGIRHSTTGQPKSKVMQIAKKTAVLRCAKREPNEAPSEHETAHHTCARLLKKGVECGNSKTPQPKEASAAKEPSQETPGHNTIINIRNSYSLVKHHIRDPF